MAHCHVPVHRNTSSMVRNRQGARPRSLATTTFSFLLAIVLAPGACWHRCDAAYATVSYLMCQEMEEEIARNNGDCLAPGPACCCFCVVYASSTSTSTTVLSPSQVLLNRNPGTIILQERLVVHDNRFPSWYSRSVFRFGGTEKPANNPDD